MTRPVGETPKERARWLLRNGWYQVSRGYRLLCRLPEGKSGAQALADAGGPPILREREAGDFFLRVYALQQEGLHMEVDRETFDAYRELGGGTYVSSCYRE